MYSTLEHTDTNKKISGDYKQRFALKVLQRISVEISNFGAQMNFQRCF